MHILAFEQKPDRFLGGQERSLFEVCRGLAGAGQDLSLVYREPGDLLEEYGRFSKEIVKLDEPYSVEWHRVNRFCVATIRLLRFQRRNGVHVVYTNQYKDAPLAAFVAAVGKLPFVCHLRIPPGPYLSRQYRWALKRAAALIAVSSFTRQQYARMGVPADRIHVVPNGIDVVGFRVGRGSADPGRRRLLYVGRLTPGKGIEVLARAFGELAARRRDVDLTVVGNVRGNDVPNGYEAALRAQFAKFGGRVEFVGHQGDICPILASADLLVVPSRCGEAFGRVVLEGMAAGLPVVASRDGGIPEILDEAFPGHLVPAGDSRALAGCLGEFIDWRATMPSLGGAMRRHVEKRFAQHTMISRVERVFEQVFEQVA